MPAIQAFLRQDTTATPFEQTVEWLDELVPRAA